MNRYTAKFHHLSPPSCPMQSRVWISSPPSPFLSNFDFTQSPHVCVNRYRVSWGAQKETALFPNLLFRMLIYNIQTHQSKQCFSHILTRTLIALPVTPHSLSYTSFCFFVLSSPVASNGDCLCFVPEGSSACSRDAPSWHLNCRQDPRAGQVSSRVIN